MKKILNKLKLTDTFSIQIPIGIDELVTKINKNIDQNSSDINDITSSSKNKFKGEFDNKGFRLKRKHKIFTDNSRTTAYGCLTEKKEATLIDIEIIGYDLMAIIFYMLTLLFYGYLSYSILSINNQNKIFLFLILFLGIINCVLPYFWMKRGMRKLKYELEREFYSLSK